MGIWTVQEMGVNRYLKTSERLQLMEKEKRNLMPFAVFGDFLVPPPEVKSTEI